LLDEIGFEVNRNETICLLGSSGSGKSTLLKIIAGLEIPDGGNVFWGEQNLDNVPVHHRNFGLMFQEYALFPHRTIAQNVAFGLEMKRTPQKIMQQQVMDALAMVGLTELADRSVTDLSGGEKQRVALARALAPQPRLLMLDEPLGALDRGLRDQLILDLRSILKQSGIPAIYVTHDQEEAYTIADRLLLLHEGKIVQQGNPQELYENPANRWVANFLGLGNQFSGVVKSNHPLILDTPLGEVEINEQRFAHLEPRKRVTLILKPAGLILLPDEKGERYATISDCIFSGELYRLSIQVKDVILKVVSRDPYAVNSVVGYQLYPDAIICIPNEE
jgi:ABC-type Fe3+/spermidine/putrescine transport system ATPase subunit